jgi:hypothetical protein
MVFHQLAATRTCHQIGRSEGEMLATVAAAMARNFSLWKSTHD